MEYQLCNGMQTIMDDNNRVERRKERCERLKMKVVALFPRSQDPRNI